MKTPILPGSTLGVLGGGQLGRMFALAARRMGYRVTVLAPEDDTPTGQLADREIRAPYEDLNAVERFAQEVAVVTFEFENVPARVAEVASRHAPVRPLGELLHTTQNRWREKQALRALGLPLPRFARIETEADLLEASQAVGLPGVLKSTAWGYDGKGQRRVTTIDELRIAREELGATAAVLEELVPFACEVSVVGARGLDGSTAVYPPFENRHVAHVLDVSVWPSALGERSRDRAMAIARTVLEDLDVVGVLCVEFFVLPDGELLVNELAPRPHNSGHLTIDTHETSQFEQQVRAVCGLPLGSVLPTAPAAAMANLLGDHWQAGEPNWGAALTDPGVRLHLYGKEEPRPRRKMGHLTATADDTHEALRRVTAARALLEVGETHWTSI